MPALFLAGFCASKTSGPQWQAASIRLGVSDKELCGWASGLPGVVDSGGSAATFAPTWCIFWHPRQQNARSCCFVALAFVPAVVLFICLKRRRSFL